MRIRRSTLVVVTTTALSGVFVGVVLAATEPLEQIPAAKQANLLERFGEEGIDADGDGVLTRTEVRAFFAEKHHAGAADMQGLMGCMHHGPKGGTHQGMMGCRHHGMKGDMHHGMMGGMDYAAMTEEQRVRMLEGHPEADADEDGVLSESEFEAFRALRMAGHRAAMLERHPEADTDEDGVLSEDELEAFRAQRMAEHQAMMLERHPEADTDGDGTLSEEEVRGFRGSHHGGIGCRAGHKDNWPGDRVGQMHKGHAGCVGHQHKEHRGCGGAKGE